MKGSTGTRIVVSGYYGSRNAGDEAMLAAMLEVLFSLDPKLHITVISARPAETAARHGVESVYWLSVPAILRALWHADLLISGGGSLLQNVTSRRSLYYYLAILSLGLIMRKKVMLYAQGIGPILGRVAAAAMRFVAGHADLITVRDEGSLLELARLGISRPKILCTADPVLAIRPESTKRGRAIFDAYHVKRGVPVVGISVREWQGESRFKDVMAEATDRIAREAGVQIVFLPMQFPEDAGAADSIASRKKESCIILRDEYTTGEFLSLVANMDLVVGIRLHALIFASVMKVPFVGISYDPKIDRFLQSVGASPVGTIENITADKLVAAFHERWGTRGHIAALPDILREKAARNAELALSLVRQGSAEQEETRKKAARRE